VSQPLGILHVLGTADEHGHALALTVRNLARGLDPERYRVAACFLSGDGPLAERLSKAGTAVSCVRWDGTLSDPRGASRFTRALVRHRPAIVHFHAGGTVPRIIARAATRARIVAHYHSLGDEGRLDRPTRRSTRLAHAVVANSRATRDRLGDPRAVVIYPSVAVAPQPTRATWGAGDRVRLGTAARLVPVKGVHHLIEALTHLTELNIVLDIAGSGPERPRLERLALDAGLADRVHFLGWRDDLEVLMTSWQIYAQPSLAEGLGISALEAMASGLPVVAGNHGGLPEVVSDGESGLLVDPRDSHALAAAIRRLVSDPEVSLRMGAAARERVARDFSAERELTALEAVYARLAP
jgi:glycosyltransferase involved in cell wall biosynthesis